MCFVFIECVIPSSLLFFLEVGIAYKCTMVLDLFASCFSYQETTRVW